MDDLLEFLLGVIVDGAAGDVDDRRAPLVVRALLTAVLLAVWLGLPLLMIGAGAGTGNRPLAVLGALFLAGAAAVAIRKLRGRKRK